MLGRGFFSRGGGGGTLRGVRDDMNQDVHAQDVEASLSPRGGVWAAVAWGSFLASSWTWIIGMLLPTILLRDFGYWGWVIFAVPNVLGAAAMGWVVSRPAQSAALVERHAGAMLRFSEITIAYHVFVVGWMFTRVLGFYALIAAAAVALVVFAVAQRRSGALGAAGVATVVSLALLAWWAVTKGAAALPEARLTTGDLLVMAPASAAGFLFCPYVDLTFHRARQATTPGTGRAAFAIGFGVLFLAMIVFSLMYGPLLTPYFGAETFPEVSAALPVAVVWVLGVHLAMQAGLTTGLHAVEVVRRRGHAGLHRMMMVGIAAGALAWWAVSEPTRVAYGISLGEGVYRFFLLAYGLGFPAYVLLCMLPTRREVAWRRKLSVLVVTLLVTLPMGYLGFVAGEAWWLPIALVVVVVARLSLDFARRGERQAV